jgi:cell division protein FtsB
MSTVTISSEERRKLSSQASPIVFRNEGRRVPAAGTIVAVLVALLILFQWLHFILALKIESAGREIQAKTEELQRIERHNHELRRQISIAGSQEQMSERSRDMGYAAQRPVYLLVDQPLPPTTQSSWPTGWELAGTVEDGARAALRWPASDPAAESDSGE